MIKDALEAKAPKTYRQLKMQGKLDEFLKDHDRAMIESLEVLTEAQKAGQEQGDWLKLIRDGKAALSRLTEETLATWLQFSDPPTTE